MITNNSIDNQKVSSRITSLFPLYCGPFIKKNRYKPQRMAFCFKILFLTNLSIEKKHLSIYLSIQAYNVLWYSMVFQIHESDRRKSFTEFVCDLLKNFGVHVVRRYRQRIWRQINYGYDRHCTNGL